MTDDQAVRWTPDEHLVDAALGGTQHMRELSDPDRAWAVAGLKLKGLTAERIADLLHCSLRQVRAVAADPTTIIVTLYMTEREAFVNEHRMSAAEITRLDAELHEALAACERGKEQVDRLLAVHLAERRGEQFSCGCPRSRYNTYVDPRSGRMSCREHRRQAVAAHRARRRASGSN